MGNHLNCFSKDSGDCSEIEKADLNNNEIDYLEIVPEVQIQQESGHILEAEMNKLHPSIKKIISKLPPFNFEVSSEETLDHPSIRFTDESTYRGPLANNKKNGFGEIIYSDGSTLKGFFINNIINGKGRLVKIDGEVY